MTWTYEVPLPAGQVQLDPNMRASYIGRFGDLLILRTSTGELQMLSPDGRVVRDRIGGDGNSSWGWEYGPGGRPILESWDTAAAPSVTLLAPDANPAADQRLKGSLVLPPVDDGSVPGLLLTAERSLHAWDVDTGAARWSSKDAPQDLQTGMPLTALVIRGRVYVLTSTGVVALDGRTGKTLWQVKPGKGQLAETLLTDAHHLLIGYERPSHDGDPLLVAYTFDHGTEVSHAALPQRHQPPRRLGRQGPRLQRGRDEYRRPELTVRRHGRPARARLPVRHVDGHAPAVRSAHRRLELASRNAAPNVEKATACPLKPRAAVRWAWSYCAGVSSVRTPWSSA